MSAQHPKKRHAQLAPEKNIQGKNMSIEKKLLSGQSPGIPCHLSCPGERHRNRLQRVRDAPDAAAREL